MNLFSACKASAFRPLVFSLVLILPLSAMAGVGQPVSQARYPDMATGNWSNPGNALGVADDQCANMGAANKLQQASNFSFSLPNDAVITDVTVSIKTGAAQEQAVGVQLAEFANTNPATNLIGDEQQLTIPDISGGNNCQNTVFSDTGSTLGDWNFGGGLTVAKINTPGFGVQLDTQDTSSVKVDAVCIQIDYTTATGPYTTNVCNRASLELIKEVVNDGGGTAAATDWTLFADGPGSEGNDFNGAGYAHEWDLDEGVYDLSESAGPASYVASNWNCSSIPDRPEENPVLVDGDTAVINIGEVVNCWITNTYAPATLTVNKIVTNDNGGTLQISDFQLYIDGHPVTSGETINVTTGQHTVSEDGASGYLPAIGGACASDGTVTLAAQDDLVCTITNDDIAPLITVIKTVVNDDGGDAVASEWTMDVTATNASSTGFPGAEDPGTDITVDANAAYSIDESGGRSGYAKSLSNECSGNLPPGGYATCTITNDDVSPTLQLVKIVENNGGAEKNPSDWNLAADGPDPINGNGGVGPVEVDAGVYTLSETALFDGVNDGSFQSPGWDCSGGDQDGDTVSLVPGDVAVCTITNFFVLFDPVPVDGPWALLLLILSMLAAGWYFRPATLRRM